MGGMNVRIKNTFVAGGANRGTCESAESRALSGQGEGGAPGLPSLMHSVSRQTAPRSADEKQ